jgi:hypothetical protein
VGVRVRRSGREREPVASRPRARSPRRRRPRRSRAETSGKPPSLHHLAHPSQHLAPQEMWLSSAVGSNQSPANPSGRFGAAFQHRPREPPPVGLRACHHPTSSYCSRVSGQWAQLPAAGDVPEGGRGRRMPGRAPAVARRVLRVLAPVPLHERQGAASADLSKLHVVERTLRRTLRLRHGPSSQGP